jgi:hydantoinase/carbamoylase family amidase
MPAIPIRPDRLRARLEALARTGADPGGGVSRFPYSQAHAEAVRLVAGWMREAGLEAGCDAYGNLIGTRPGRDGWPAILLASHLDSVPQGGIFDGALGVVAGVEVAQALAEAARAPGHALAVIGFADEEGYWFGVGTLASRCLIGEVPPARIQTLRGRDGRTLAEAQAAFAHGLPPARVPSDAGAYLELHVEQGPVLASSGRRVAVVTAITGIARTEVALEGEANHAGTTPMTGRRDALVGAAAVVLAVRALAEAAGAPTVGTVGALRVHPGVTNIVPGRVEFTIEFRTPDGARLRRLCEDAEQQVRAAADRGGLALRLAPWDLRDPVPMAPQVRSAIEEAIAASGCDPYAMASGAGHDAMILAPHVPAGMIFVASQGGVSHSPREWTTWEDAALGAEVLLRTVLALDARGPLPPHRLPLAPAPPAPDAPQQGLGR